MRTPRDTPKPQEGTAPADETTESDTAGEQPTPDEVDAALKAVEGDGAEESADDEDREVSEGHDDPDSNRGHDVDGSDGDRDARPHGNREAAKYRVRARDAEQKLAAVTAELEALKDDNFVRDLSGLHPGVKGATLHALGLTRESVTGEDGTVDEKAVRARAEVLVREHGLRPVVPGQPPVTGDRTGSFRVESGASWSGLLGGSAR